MRALAVEKLGRTIVRSRDNSPRCLLVYRAASGQPGKLSISGTAGKIEVLGRGQQFVAYGRHPSGAELQWLEGGPADVKALACPTVTEEAVEAFLRAAAPLIGAVVAEPRKAKGHDAGVGALTRRSTRRGCGA